MKINIKFEDCGVTFTESDLINSINDYKKRYEATYTSFQQIMNVIRNVFKVYFFDYGFYCPEDNIHVPVCSDWPDKVYVFEPLRVTMVNDEDIVYFKVAYKGIWKI